jgi:hypothetical protein
MNKWKLGYGVFYGLVCLRVLVEPTEFYLLGLVNFSAFYLATYFLIVCVKKQWKRYREKEPRLLY